MQIRIIITSYIFSYTFHFFQYITQLFFTNIIISLPLTFLLFFFLNPLLRDLINEIYNKVKLTFLLFKNLSISIIKCLSRHTSFMRAWTRPTSTGLWWLSTKYKKLHVAYFELDSLFSWFYMFKWFYIYTTNSPRDI